MLREGIVLLVIAVVVAESGLVTLHKAVDPTDDGNRYILAADYNKMTSTVLEKINELKKNESLQIDTIWTIETGFKFIYVEMNKAGLQAVRNFTDVLAYIEQDCWLYPQAEATSDEPPPQEDGKGAGNKTAKVKGIEVGPDRWGLDRIDQRTVPLDNVYSVNPNAGTDTSIYVVDTGVHAKHEDFEDRASNIYDFRGEDWNGRDCNGHGTILASVAAGKKFGVAKNATIYGVRVTRCTGAGRMSDSVKAINWIVKRMENKCVVLFGLSSPGKSPSLDNAMYRMYMKGCMVVVPAGNNNSLACNYSPAKGEGPLTVGASTAADYTLYYSNHGDCVDLFAPGKSIVGAYYDGSKTATESRGGTSIAAAHVAGAAAYHLGNNMPMGKVKGYITRHASEYQLQNVQKKTPNKLLYIGKVKTSDDYERKYKPAKISSDSSTETADKPAKTEL